MAVAGAAVHLTGADRRAHQLLEQVEFLVRAAGSDESRDRVGAVLGLDGLQPPDPRVHDFKPGARHEPLLRADQGHTQPLFAVDVLEPEAAAHAQPPVPLGGLRAITPFVLPGDRKSTRLNSSHVRISYAVFCLKKKTTIMRIRSSWQ